MLSKFLRTESYRAGIVFSVAANALARALGFVTLLVVGFYFGAGSDADVYFYCLATVAFAAGFVTALNNSVVIPESMRLEAQEGRARASAFINFFLYGYIAIAVLLCAAFSLNPVASFLTISRFDPTLLSANAGVLRLAIVFLGLNLVACYLTEIAVSLKFFTMPMISNLVINVLVICSLAAFHGRLGIKSALLGLIAGNAAQILVIAGLMRRSLGWDFRPGKIRLGDRTIGNIIHTQLGSVSGIFGYYVPLFVLSGLGKGVISSLNYGRQLSEMPHLFVTYQFSSVAGIKLNELKAKEDHAAMDAVFLSSAKFLLFILAPCSALMALYSHEAVSVIFGRGKFTPEAVGQCSVFLRYFAFVLPFIVFNTLMTRVLLASQKVAQGVWYQVAGNAVTLAIALPVIHLMGAPGYPAAIILFYVVNTTGLYFLAARLFPWLDYLASVRYFIKIAALNLAVAVPVLALKFSLKTVPPIANILAGTCAYCLILFALNQKFGFNEDVRSGFSLLKARIFERANAA